MGEKLNKFGNHLIQSIIVILVFICIFYSDKQIDNENNKTLISIIIISLLFISKGYINKLGDTPMLLVYGLYIIAIYGYTFYQWQVSSKKTDTKCSMTIPRTKNFSKSQYYLYRIMYLTTIIVIVVLIQNLLDKGGDLSTWKINPQNFVVMLPFILPILTESVNGLVSIPSGEEYSINPESLLANFMLGDSKSDPLEPGSWPRLTMPIVFYLILIIYAFIFSYLGESNTPIYFMLIFVIGFSFWMRTIFVQDCSLKHDKDISKDKDEDVEGKFLCLFEKYGGLQAIIATCFLINMLSYIKNPVYKLFVFIIIGLASGLLSTVFILNLKK
tara:strand:+ start:631 stop:1617 length:987 start_codon:yes stop_codon:yes gene_type:complete